MMVRFVSIEELALLLRGERVSADGHFGKAIRQDSLTECEGRAIFAFASIEASAGVWDRYWSLPAVLIRPRSADSILGQGTARYRRYSLWGDYDDLGGYDEELCPEVYLTGYGLDDVEDIIWVEDSWAEEYLSRYTLTESLPVEDWDACVPEGWEGILSERDIAVALNRIAEARVVNPRQGDGG